jgi:thioredoxin reductase (NADPH)
MDGTDCLDMVVIGAGPAGISMAAEAIATGIEAKKIVVLEKEQAHSWSIRKYYPEEKVVAANYKGQGTLCHGVICFSDMSKKETLSYMDKVIGDYSIRVEYQTAVQSIRKENNLFRIVANDTVYLSKTCVIAIGIFGRPNKPDYEIPAEIKDLVKFDITSKDYRGETVLIVGGGDSASEYCQYLAEKGNRVYLTYRKGEFSRMNMINRQSLLTLEDMKKVVLLRSSNIKKLSRAENMVRVAFEEQHYNHLDFNTVVYALGGTTPDNFLKLVGIDYQGGKPVLKDNFETSVPGLFLIGDLSSDKKGGSIISAFNSAHFVMKKGALEYLA